MKRANEIRWWRTARSAVPALGLLLLLPAGHANPAGEALRARLAAAEPGATVRVDAGVYEGKWVIEKPVRLLGAPGAVLQGDRHGSVVVIRAADVELGGFVVRGSGRNLFEDDAAIFVTAPRAFIHDNRIRDMLHGIYVRKANDCRVVANAIFGDGAAGDRLEDPVRAGLSASDAASGELCGAPAPQDRRGNGVHLWNSSGHLVAGNTIRGTRDGVYFSFTSRTTTRGNRITGVRYGLHYMYSDENVFEGNVFSENAAGAALMYSKKLVLRANRFVSNRSQRAYGLLLQSVDDTRIEDNTIAGNTLGLFFENANNDTLRGNRVTGNYVGLRLSASTAGCRFFENTFAGNIHAVESGGTDPTNLWAVAGRGNHWDDALALDLNHDGVADLPHREPDLFGALRRTFPSIGLLSASPGERLLRLIYGRLALPGMTGIADPRPLTSRRNSP